MPTSRLPFVPALVAVTAAAALGAPQSRVRPSFPVHYHEGTTKKLCQFTGDWDHAWRKATDTLTKTQASLVSTDLGSTFEHEGRLYFLFGDTFGRAGNVSDTLAYTTSTAPEGFALTIPTAADGKFRVIDIPGITEGGMEVPSAGISYEDTMYVVFTTQWYDPTGNMERSVMARSLDDGATWENLYTLSKVGAQHDMADTHFVNASLVLVNAADWPGLPYSGDVLLVFGSGAYRASDVYLACMPAGAIADRSTLRYLSDAGGVAPVWSAQEADAAPLFQQPQIGEFSVAYAPPLRSWITLYNASSPRGITMRSAPAPWGPWSPGEVVLQPWQDGAYGNFIHVSWSYAHMDFMQDGDVPWRDAWGGEYGPYIVPRWSDGDADAFRLRYVLSTWNPYDCIVVESELGQRPAPLPPDATTTTELPGSTQDWKSTAAPWYSTYHEPLDGGQTWITTWVPPNPDDETGLMYRWLPRDAHNKRLEFRVSGGNQQVLLLEGGGDIPTTGDVATIHADIKAGLYGKVVQCTWGHSDNTILVPVTWRLSAYDSANLKVVIVDKDSVPPWKFVGVGPMTLTRTQ